MNGDDAGGHNHLRELLRIPLSRGLVVLTHVPIQNAGEEGGGGFPDVHLGILPDDLVPAQSERTSLAVSEKEPVEHFLETGIRLIDKQIEQPPLDRKLAAERLALDVALGGGVVLR